MTAMTNAGDDLEACIGEACITCGDVALELEVLSVGRDESRCRTEDGEIEMVATDLVDPVAPGDRILVHAGVAIVKLDAIHPADTG